MGSNWTANSATVNKMNEALAAAATDARGARRAARALSKAKPVDPAEADARIMAISLSKLIDAMTLIHDVQGNLAMAANDIATGLVGAYCEDDRNAS